MEGEVNTAVVVGPGGRIRVEAVAMPDPEIDEALVRVRLAGISSADLSLLRGFHDFEGIPGHEFVGEVVQQQSSTSMLRRRVVAHVNIPCGECEVCNNSSMSGDAIIDKRNHCPRKRILGVRGAPGAMATYVAVPLRNLRVVPVEVPDRIAIFAHPVAAALRVLEQNLVKPTSDVAILGDGPMGWLIALVVSQFFGIARRRNTDDEGMSQSSVGRHQLTIIGKHPENANSLLPSLMALSGCAVNFVISPSTTSSGVLYQRRNSFQLGGTQPIPFVTAAVNDNGDASSMKHKLPSDSFDVCVEVSGKGRAFPEALRLVKPRGTVVLKSTCWHETPITETQLSSKVLDLCASKEITVVGSSCGSISDSLEFLACGCCPSFDLPWPETPQVSVSLTVGTIHDFLSNLISATVSLRHAAAGFSAANTPGTLKVLLDCESYRSSSEA